MVHWNGFAPGILYASDMASALVVFGGQTTIDCSKQEMKTGHHEA